MKHQLVGIDVGQDCEEDNEQSAYGDCHFAQYPAGLAPREYEQGYSSDNERDFQKWPVPHDRQSRRQFPGALMSKWANHVKGIRENQKRDQDANS